MKTSNNSKTDREHLELLVYICLTSDEPNISMSRGRELLGFRYMEDMREWLRDFRDPYLRVPGGLPK